MAVTDTVADMIAAICARFRLSDSGARAKALQWLQESEEHVWGLRDWWFRRDEQDLVFTEGERIYTLEDATAVYEIENPDGSHPEFLPVSTFLGLLRGEVAAGAAVAWTEAPVLWTQVAPNSPVGNLRVEVFPAPSLASAGTGKMVIDRKHLTLSDSANSSSGLPSDFRQVVLLGAEIRAAIFDNQLETKQLLEKEWEGALAGMMAEQARHRPIGRR